MSLLCQNVLCVPKLSPQPFLSQPQPCVPTNVISQVNVMRPMTTSLVPTSKRRIYEKSGLSLSGGITTLILSLFHFYDLFLKPSVLDSILAEESTKV